MQLFFAKKLQCLLILPINLSGRKSANIKPGPGFWFNYSKPCLQYVYLVMPIPVEELLLLGSVLLLISIISSKTSYKFGIPTLLLFLAVGMLAGSDGIGGIEFNNYNLAQLIGIVALTFILFSGGLETKWESVKPVLWRGISLSTIGVVITALGIALFVQLVTDFSFTEGLLLGAIVSSTDAAAVFSILRAKNIGLKRNLRPTLELESGSNDPMAFFLTISLTALLTNTSTTVPELIIDFFREMILGAIAGYLMGLFMVKLINGIKLEVDGLYPVLVLALMFLTYGATHFIGGNGFLAIYLAGIYLGNKQFIHKKSLIRFYDGQAWLMQIILFLTLGLLVYPHQIVPLIGIGLLISLFVIFVARPVGVYISLVFFGMKHREKLFISWVGLRGAVPIVFAIYPLIAGVEKANLIFNLVFFIAVTSIVLQGSTLHKVAAWLHLIVPENAKRRFPVDIELSDSISKELAEIQIIQSSAAIGSKIVDLQIPKSVLIVMINRNNKYITPNGNTRIEEGDKLLVMAEDTSGIEKINELF